QNLFVTLERWNEVGAGKLAPRPSEHLPCNLEAAIARSSSGSFHGLQQRLRNNHARHFVVQPQRLLIAIERPDPDQDGNGRLVAKLFQKRVPMLRKSLATSRPFPS